MTVEGKYDTNLEFFQGDSTWGLMIVEEGHTVASIELSDSVAAEVALRVMDCADYDHSSAVMVELNEEVESARAKVEADEEIRRWAKAMNISIANDLPIPYKTRQAFNKQKEFWQGGREC